MPSDFATRDLVLEYIRQLRFGGSSSRCLHCSHPGVIRWGSFSGRQRYRCQGCRRTYSDLTGTPLARTKRIARWPSALAEFDATSTLRAGSIPAGIHPSTSFRWRHRVLGTLSVRENPGWDSSVVLHRYALPFVGPCGARTHGTISSRFYPPPPGLHRKGSFWIVAAVGRNRRGRGAGLLLDDLGVDRHSWPTRSSGEIRTLVSPGGTIWAREGSHGPTRRLARVSAGCNVPLSPIEMSHLRSRR